MKPAYLKSLILLAAFTAAVTLRVLIGGVAVAHSAAAGLIFAACLIGLGLAARTRADITRQAIATGLAGALILCVPAIIVRLTAGQAHPPAGSFIAWAGVVALVAAAEEYFLRGTLYEAVSDWLGRPSAIILTSAAFALLHVPLYGWQVVPLDLAVGGWLGLLRAHSGSPTAPATAHILADLAGWGLR